MSGFSLEVVRGVDFKRFANVLKYFQNDRVYRPVRFWHSQVFLFYLTHQITIGTMSRWSKYLTPIFDIQSHPFCPGSPRKTLITFLRYSMPHRNQTNSNTIDTQDKVQASSPVVLSALTLHVHNALRHLFGILVFLYSGMNRLVRSWLQVRMPIANPC